MSAFAQTVTGDLDLTGGNLRIEVDRATLVAQKLTNKFQLFQGEWFLDTRLGVPYFQALLVKAPNLNVVRAILAEVVTSTPGVIELQELSVSFNAGTRELTYSFKAKVDENAVVSGGSGAPFIITRG